MSHEQHLTLDLVSRLADRFGPSSRVAKELPGWLEHLTGVTCPERPRTRPGEIWWKKIRELTRNLVPAEGGGEAEIVQQNAYLLGTHLGLVVSEIRVMIFMLLYQRFGSFERIVDSALGTKEVALPLLLSWFCEAQEGEVRAALRPNGRLVASGLVRQLEYGARPVPWYLSDRICSALMAEVQEVNELLALLFPPAPVPEAEWQDFEGLGRDAELMRDLLTRALASGVVGVNILLYGTPGTGKTEFAKVLAREVGAELCVVGESDGYGGEPSRRERVAEIGTICQMLGTRSDTVLLFDEMEDVIGSSIPFSDKDRPSKVYFNRMLETNPIPVIWTTNSVETCDPAFLRRMSFSALMRPPSGRVRGRIWQRLGQRHGMEIASTALSRLAETHDQAPALVSDAMRLSRLCEGDEGMVSHMLDAAACLARGGGDVAPKHHSDVPWQSGLARTDVDLLRIEARLSSPAASHRISFCLEGPAGTGKSAWARHLALQIGLPVIEKRASDLMSMWVGGSEKNVARAFADARADGAMLIFDEADSLLADRRGADHSWEVSQVNEMLTWMESHPLPFVCTTNFAERLDPATQRRFTFRIRFDWLAPAQLPLAWAAHFSGPAPAGLSALDRLAPGDFANVARRMRTLGEADPEVILRELAREVDAKEGVSRPIGFGR